MRLYHLFKIMKQMTFFSDVPILFPELSGTRADQLIRMPSLFHGPKLHLTKILFFFFTHFRAVE